MQPAGKPSTFFLVIPLVVWLIYHLTTISLFVFSPFDWPVNNPFILGMFLGAVTIAILSGYLLALFLPAQKASYIGLRTIAYWGTTLGLMISVPAMYLYTGKTPADLGHALSNQGEVYQEMVIAAESQAGGRIYFAALRSVLAPLTFAVLPLFILYWKRIPFYWRFIGILFALSQLAFGVLRGTDKETVDLGIVISVSLISVALLANRSGTFSGKKLGAIALVGILMMTLVAQIFIWRKNARLGDMPQTYCHHLTGRCADYENVLVRWLPDSNRLGAILAINYLSQGYYGLSMALEEDFTTTYGIGHSSFVLDKVTAMLGSDTLVKHSYIGKLHERGWDRKRVWSTLYTWIANDVGFTGTILVMFLVGFVFSLSWKDFISTGNAAALIVFLQFVILFFYASMNNQIMQTADQYFAFVVWMVLWIKNRSAIL